MEELDAMLNTGCRWLAHRLKSIYRAPSPTEFAEAAAIYIHRNIKARGVRAPGPLNSGDHYHSSIRTNNPKYRSKTLVMEKLESFQPSAVPR